MKEDFKSSSINLLILSTVASAINYASQIISGRILPVEVFGSLNSIFAIIIMLSIPGTSIYMIISKYIAEHKSEFQRQQFIRRTTTFMFSLITGALIVLFIVSLLFGNFSSFGNRNEFVLVSLIISFGLIYPVYTGALTGYKRFVAVGLLSMIIPLSRLFGVILSVFFSSTYISQQEIILFFMLVGSVILYFVGRNIIKPHYKLNEINQFDDVVKKDKFKISTAMIMIILINSLFTFFTNADLLFINFFFGSAISGLYSSTMLFGKIVFYFVTSLVAVMLPFVASANVEGGNPIIVLKNAIKYTLLLVIICLLPLNIFPEFFLKFIYGNRYIAAFVYMRFSSIIAVLLSLINVTMIFLIGINQTKNLVFTFVFGLVVSILLMMVFHNDLSIVLFNLIIGLTSTLSLNLYFCFKNRT